MGLYINNWCMYTIGVAIAAVAMLFSSNLFLSLVALFSAVMCFSSVISTAVSLLQFYSNEEFPHFISGVVITSVGLAGIIVLLFSSLTVSPQHPTRYLLIRSEFMFVAFAASLVLIFFL